MYMMRTPRSQRTPGAAATTATPGAGQGGGAAARDIAAHGAGTGNMVTVLVAAAVRMLASAGAGTPGRGGGGTAPVRLDFLEELVDMCSGHMPLSPFYTIFPSGEGPITQSFEVF